MLTNFGGVPMIIPKDTSLQNQIKIKIKICHKNVRMRVLKIWKFSTFSVTFFIIFRGMIYTEKKSLVENWALLRFSSRLVITCAVLLITCYKNVRMRVLKIWKFSTFSVNFFKIFRGMIYIEKKKFGGKLSTFEIFDFHILYII